MQPVVGYVLGKSLYLGERSQVWAAVRASDGREVVLKAYRDDDHVEAEERGRRELETLRKLEGPGIPAALELTSNSEAPVLVLERAPGVSLSHWVSTTLPTPRQFLEVCSQLADAVSRVHQARLLHRDISPANVMVDPATLRAQLIDFDHARPLGTALRGGEAGLVSSGLGGTLAYISPEATRRMNRGLDSRSDLYSLGATMYFALTGRTPFDSDDPLTLIHAHIAKVPVPAHELRAELPVRISQIVQKLLQKSPEERYQTAYALACDLRDCSEQLRSTGSIASDAPLGSVDVPHRPLFSKRLYGREAEVGQLQGAYAAAAVGAPRLLLLSGPPGIGKSELLQELRTRLAETGGYLALGKFDQYRRDVPYAGFAAAFASLVQQILTESDVRLAGWRSALGDRLGAIAGALVDLVPDLALVLGDVPPVPALGPAEMRARLALAVRYFIQAAATREHPLVLGLDDLQWADAASLDLLQTLLLGGGSEALLVAGLYRDVEVGPEHALLARVAALEAAGVCIERVALGPLDDAACAQMLAQALGRSAAQTRPLALAVARKTANFPLLVQQFIYHAYDQGLIYFAPGAGWTWDERALAAADIPDDAVALMTAKLARLPAPLIEVLGLASCAGDAFDLEGLAALTERAPATVATALFALCDEGLIAPAPQGFRFVHDRIREAAQNLLGDARRAALHQQAARLLLARTPADQLGPRLFEIADHLLLAEAPRDEAERLRTLHLQYLAGKRALAAGAAVTAAHYFAAAHAHFRESDWSGQCELAIDLFLQAAEAAHQKADYPTALARLDELDRQPLERADAARAASKRIAAEALILPAPELLPRVIATLQRFELSCPAAPSRLRIAFEIWRTERALRGALDATAFRAPEGGDPSRWMANLMVYVAAVPCVVMYSQSLFVLIMGSMLRLQRQHGAGQALANSLASWAALRVAVFRDSRGSERYARAALDWSQRLPDPSSQARTEYLLLSYVYPWTRMRRSVTEPLAAVAQRLFELGEHDYGIYALILRIIHMTLSGESLETIEKEQARIEPHLRGTQLEPIGAQQVAILRLLQLDEPDAERERKFREFGQQVLQQRGHQFGLLSIWLMIQAVFGRFEAVFEQSGAALEVLGPAAADLLFFRGVAAAALCSDPAQASSRRRLQRVARRSARVLARWERQKPELKHMVRVLHAEGVRLRGRSAAALTLYTQAIQHALGAGYLHHAAFVHERKSELFALLRRGIEARSERERAIELYEQWGARGKAESLRRAPPP